MNEQPQGSVGEVLRLATRLGFTAFGGPAAHIAMLHDEVVTRRGWIDEQHFLDMVGATNLVPGPNSTEMVIHMGYHRAGFTEIIGIDIEPQPNYPFTFIQGDATDPATWMPYGPFDLVHASPPCQAYTTMNNRHGSASSPLIAETRHWIAYGDPTLPYVLENVAGAKSEMKDPVELTGEMFGLGVHRPRLFELGGWTALVPHRPRQQHNPAAVYGKEDGRRLRTRADGTELRVANLETGSQAMGIDWMTWDELREAIPPAYTEYIGEAFIEQRNR